MAVLFSQTSHGDKDIFSDQVKTRLRLKPEAICDLGLFDFALNTQSCVLSTGDLLVGGYNEAGDDYQLQIFNKDGSPTGQAIHTLCEHKYNINYLAIVIDRTEYIAVSCENCRKIRLVNPQAPEQQSISAYTAEGGEVGPMCLGPGGTLYTVGCSTGKVSLLDCSSTQFTLKHKLPEIDKIQATDICYVAAADLLILCSHWDSRVYAVSNGGAIVWRISGRVDNKQWKPQGLLYLSQDDLLLVCDRLNKRILVLAGGSGSLLQTIDMDEEMWYIDNLHLIDAKLVVRYHTSGELHIKVSFFAISFLHEDALAKAYREACEEGSSYSYRAKINLIGHEGGGKTSLADNLLGKEFKEEQSTEGIATHHIKSTFNKNVEKGEIWTETTKDTEDIVTDFNKFVLEKSEEFVQLQPTRPKDLPKAESTTKVKEAGPLESTSEFYQSPVDQSDKTEHEQAKLKFASKTKLSRVSSGTIKQMLSPKRQSTFKFVDEDIPYSVSLWDHGGQDEFIATHHLFLDVEATTLIVMDISKNFKNPLKQTLEESRKLGYPKTQKDILCYWLNSIHIQAEEKGIQPSIALVLTHKDVIQSQDAAKYIESYINEVLEAVKGEPYSTYISKENIHVIDNKTGSQDDFKQLRSQLFQMITQQKGWGKERPVRWLKLEADILERAISEEKKYLQRSVVNELAAVYGIKDSDLESFLEFHTTLGDLLYFPEPALKDVVITDPQWLVDTFKTLITPHEFLDKRKLQPTLLQQLKRGVVYEENLKILWKQTDVQFLKEVMIKFNLMFPLETALETERRFLIPCMLPPRDLNMYDTDLFKSMTLAYNATHGPKSGEILQIGTFHRLLSRCSQRSHWKICADDHLSYTDASLDIGNGFRLALTLMSSGRNTNANTMIRASVWSKKDVDKTKIQQTILKTRKSLEEEFTDLNVAQSKLFLILCPYWDPGDVDSCLVELKDLQDSSTGTRTGPQMVKEGSCTFHGQLLRQSDFASTEDETLETETENAVSSIRSETPMKLKSLIHAKFVNLPRGATCRSKCPATMYKNRRKYNATVTQGEATALQGDGSDVSLDVTDGSPGVFMTHVELDHSRFARVVPDSECVISPFVEVNRLSSSQPEDGRKPVHIVKIPHCVRNRSLWRNIVVRKGDVDNVDENPFQELRQRNRSSEYDRDQTAEDDAHYEVDSRYITVHTRGFSQFVCSLCGNTCSGTVEVFLLAQLQQSHEYKVTTVKVKAFLCSDLYRILDFKTELERLQKPCRIVAQQGLDLDRDNNDPRKDLVSMRISAAKLNALYWEPADDEAPYWEDQGQYFIKSRNLSTVMHLEGCHTCRSSPYPSDAMTVDLISSGMRCEFHGRFVLVVDVACNSSGASDGRTGESGGKGAGASDRRTGESDGPRARQYDDNRTQIMFKVESENMNLDTQTGPELTDTRLWNIAQKIAREEDVRKLAMTGLKMEEHIVQAHITNNPKAITLCSHGVLKDWRKSQADARTAYGGLCKALLDADMAMYIQALK